MESTLPPADLSSRVYVSQRLKLHYVDWGNDGAPPLLLQHGGHDHCRTWDWVAERLRGDYHVVAPDLRGHGDSDWSPDGSYSLTTHVYDFAQLVHQRKLGPLRIVAHSLGGMIALRYAALYPETIERLVIVEGLGGLMQWERDFAAQPIDARIRGWIDQQRALAARSPRRYASIEEAFARMRAENGRLTPEQARHLTVHGVRQNEDGTYSWKFDNYTRPVTPVDIAPGALRRLWGRITCPTLLVWGRESWLPIPDEDRVADFADARLTVLDGAGHWVHHDRLEGFVDQVRTFLK